jgi:hypothetical protein
VKQRLYHGTSKDIQEFDPSTAATQTGNPTSHFGTFLSDSPKEAGRYARDWQRGGTHGGNVMPVHVQMKNPYPMSYKEYDHFSNGEFNRFMGNMSEEAREKNRQEAMQDVLARKKELMDLGHDGIVVKVGGINEYIPFEPTQIKSAIGNRGTYDIGDPDITKAEGGGAFKTLQFKDAQHFDGGGIAVDLSEPSEDARREPVLTEKDWANIKRNSPKLYKLAKEQAAQEASQLTTAGGAKDFALRTGAQYLGGIPDLINLGLMGVDAGLDTNLSSERPWLGSERYLDALKSSGAIGENEFPLSETLAGILAPAGLIKKGMKKMRKMPSPKEEPKKRLGGLTALSR